MTPELVWAVGAELGEGPMWRACEAALWFVDIAKGELHCFYPQSGRKLTLHVGGAPSFILPEIGGDLLVGSKSAIYRMSDAGLGGVVAEIVQPAHNRTNDATVDDNGAIWFGTMDDLETRATGAVWRLDLFGLHDTGLRAVVTNGPAVSANNALLYHVDSSARTIWRHRIGDGCILEPGEVFVRLRAEDGYPDGVVVDSEGCLWVALWDGWGVRRYAPNGALLDHIRVPCARVTKVAFGGPALKTVYVTTARIGLSADALCDQPLAGGLFAFETDVIGRALTEARLA